MDNRRYKTNPDSVSRKFYIHQQISGLDLGSYLVAYPFYPYPPALFIRKYLSDRNK